MRLLAMRRVLMVLMWVACVATTTLSAARLEASPRQCAPRPLRVTPVHGSNLRRYQAQGSGLRIRFVSARPGERVEVFPEGPVELMGPNGKRCRIADGGVWSASGVYVGAQGTRVLLVESSGSNSVVAVYNAHTCARLGEVDVSDAVWALTGGGVRVGRDCSARTLDRCRTVTEVPLDAGCVPSP